LLLEHCSQGIHTGAVSHVQYSSPGRRVKPEKVFITEPEDSVPKIGDLGMARFTSAGSVLTKTPGETLLFQAPEMPSI
jgi:hypothetical protein